MKEKIKESLDVGQGQDNPVIEVNRLVKSFNHRPALKGIDLRIPQGQTMVVFGPNGAGKTTLLKILATVMKPTSGQVRINEVSLNENPDAVRRQIGVVSHQSFLYGSLTASENLEFYCRLHDVANPRQRAAEAAAMVGMTYRLNDRVDTFSRGMQQRVSIARSLLHRPSILLMDEPETGLDQQGIVMLWDLIRREGTTVILTTHNMERGLELADRVVIMNKGKIALDASATAIDLDGCKNAYFELTGG